MDEYCVISCEGFSQEMSAITYYCIDYGRRYRNPQKSSLLCFQGDPLRLPDVWAVAPYTAAPIGASIVGYPPIKGEAERFKYGSIFVAEPTVASHSHGLAFCIFPVGSTPSGPSFSRSWSCRSFLGGTFCLFTVRSPSRSWFCPGVCNVFEGS